MKFVAMLSLVLAGFAFANTDLGHINAETITPEIAGEDVICSQVFVYANLTNGLGFSSPNSWMIADDFTYAMGGFIDFIQIWAIYASSNATGFMDVTGGEERALAQGIFAAQASVYGSNANIFSPYYRQMSTQVAVEPGMLATDTAEFKRGAVDVERAFDYYIENLNEGRPFIIRRGDSPTWKSVDAVMTELTRVVEG